MPSEARNHTQLASLRPPNPLPLCSALHAALLQNLISKLLFEVHLKTPMAVSFFTGALIRDVWGERDVSASEPRVRHTSDISAGPVDGGALHSIQL